MMRGSGKLTYQLARRIAVAVVGSTVLLVGIVMIVAPGPAIIAIPVGLVILSAEFAWARFWLHRLRQSISAQNQKNHSKQAERHRVR
jgi:tellurite resistance protein TerC